MQAKLDLNHGFSRGSRFLCESIFAGGFGWWRFTDLLEQRRANNQTDVAIIRIEQLYPYPHEDVKKALEPYAHVTDYVWCQEEPLNQGAWYCSKHNFDSSLPEHVKLKYAGRPASASPAVGYMSLHTKQQKQLVEDALTL